MRILLLLGAIGLGFCSTSNAQNSGVAVEVDYVLQPLDLLRIVVFQEPDLERQVRISQEYTIHLPLIGTVDLSGRSVRQAEELLRERYDADFLKNPQITITVLEYTVRTVQVLGSVNQPGAIAFTPEQQMGMLEAIARAGGFNRLAERRRVRLTRTLSDGRSENVTINVDELIQGNSTEKWLLKKGDIIFVPERIL
ncbi:MAG: polysaccharide biosynthesis/export family protein [Candidatus Didemnitutus sp.]|nr:polysaccharide biosynthesis/export family protein [Candidatus Didemnitutus sp.]